MSGSAGGDRIKREDFLPTYKDYETKVLKKYPSYKRSAISGSFNASTKVDFGDIDLIVQVTSGDPKSAKVEFGKFLEGFGDDVIVPFKSDKYEGKKFRPSGELVTILYPQKGSDKTIQIDNIFVFNDEEFEFKKKFLDFPAEVQGLILGMTKCATVEEPVADICKRLGIKTNLKHKENEDFEFNLSSYELQLRKVVLTDGFKEESRTIVWTSTKWGDVEKLLKGYDLSKPFESLLSDLKQNLKNPRSKKRVIGLFKSMVSVKVGEVGTPKGEGKLKAIAAVEKVLSEGKQFKSFEEYLK